MPSFNDVSIKILGVHRRKIERLSSRTVGEIYKVLRYDTNATAYIYKGGSAGYRKNDILQSDNWNYVAADVWDNPDLTEAENEAQSGNLPIADDNPQQ